jgi:hypothetical protein
MGGHSQSYSSKCPGSLSHSIPVKKLKWVIVV